MSKASWSGASFTRTGLLAMREDGTLGEGQAPSLLDTRSLTRYFRIGGLFGRKLHAVDGVSLTVNEREIVALVGKAAVERAP
jgi:ABC-type glutathione transport system ATPase component